MSKEGLKQEASLAIYTLGQQSPCLVHRHVVQSAAASLQACASSLNLQELSGRCVAVCSVPEGYDGTPIATLQEVGTAST